MAKSGAHARVAALPESFAWPWRSRCAARPRISTGELKHNVVALAKAAKALKLPIVVTTTARDSMWGRHSPN